jgi:hypothetical protein
VRIQGVGFVEVTGNLEKIIFDGLGDKTVEE